LFIAAYNDALNRAVQLRAMEATGWLLNVPFRYKLWIDRSPPLNPVEGLILDTRPKPDDEVRYFTETQFSTASDTLFLPGVLGYFG